MKANVFLGIFIFFTLKAVNNADRYCVIKSRQLYSKVSQAVTQGSKWILDEQEKDGKWFDVHTTGNVLAHLRMLGYDLEETKACTKTFNKAADFLQKSKIAIKNEHGGRLAYIIMGLKALCKDPTSYNGMDLTTQLLEDLRNFPKGEFNHWFQYSLALTALGISNVNVPSKYPMKLVHKIEHILRTRQQHSKDTCAMMVIAFASVYKQFEKQPVGNKIKQIMLKVASTLAKKVSIEQDNIWTKSLVMQAQTAANSVLKEKEHVLWKTERCNDIYNSILSKKRRGGSFGGLSANLHVLPALAGVSYLDLMNDDVCPATIKGNKSQEKIKVCVKIEFEGINKRNPPRQMLVMVNGSTAMDALNAAALMPSGCQIVSKKTSWGESIQSICGVAVNHRKKMYWMFYIDGKMASTGVGNYYPKTDECVIMRYQKIKF